MKKFDFQMDGKRHANVYVANDHAQAAMDIITRQIYTDNVTLLESISEAGTRQIHITWDRLCEDEDIEQLEKELKRLVGELTLDPLIQQAKDEGFLVRVKYRSATEHIVGTIEPHIHEDCHKFQPSNGFKKDYRRDVEIQEIVAWTEEEMPTPLGDQVWTWLSHDSGFDFYDNTGGLDTVIATVYSEEMKKIVLGIPGLVKAVQAGIDDYDTRMEHRCVFSSKYTYFIEGLRDALKAMGVES